MFLSVFDRKELLKNGFRYEANRNIFIHTSKILFFGSVKMQFHTKFCWFYKEQSLKNVYLPKYCFVKKKHQKHANWIWNMTEVSLMCVKKTPNKNIQKHVRRLCKKYWICQKKRHGHSFASVDFIFNQKKCFHITFQLIEHGYWTSSTFYVSFFLTNYLSVSFYFFENEIKNILKHFFYEKMVSFLFFCL